MNKFYTLLLLSGAAISANAQQINGDFEGDWGKCTPWTSTNNTNSIGTQPAGWYASNVYNRRAAKIAVVAETKGNNSDKAVLLKNGNWAGQAVPAYLTLGTPWATAETWLKSVRNADGGTFGGQKFTNHPDAISFDYKRDNSHGEENATVVAYLWKGQWTQKDVPGNTAVGIFGYGNATKADMVNRDRNILGINTILGGDVTKTADAALVASLNVPIEGNTKVTTKNEKGEDVVDYEWKNMVVPFKYNDANATVENINVIFSATDYFGDRDKIVANNSLTIDNVKLVYYHALSSLVPQDKNGNDVDINFDPAVLSYTVNSTYDEDFTEVNYEKKGIGSTVDAEYDNATSQYVITVKGEDYDEETNPDAKTVYTIQYQKPAPVLSSLVVGGHEFISLRSETTDFKATGKFSGDIDYQAAKYAGEVDVLPGYDDEANKLTVTVSAENAPSTVYTITFANQEKEPVFQIPNSDFENWTADGSALAESWNSFESAAGLWASFASMSPKPEKIESYDSSNAVRLTSKDLWVAYANGNMTTGHINMGNTDPTDASNFNFTDRTDVNGNLPLAAYPDAFEVYARFTPGTLKAGVNPDTKLQGRVQLIIHNEGGYHDPELDYQANEKIASASVLIPESFDWERYIGEFKYTGNERTGENIYLLASATTNPVPGASKDDMLDLDNLKLIYYHTLSDLKFDGKTVEGFNPEKTEYEIEGNIDDDWEKVTFVNAGVASTYGVEHDFENNFMKITVTGNDFAVNPDSKTVYTIKFVKPTGISSISAEDAKNHKVYTIGGVRVNGKPAAGLYIVDGKKMMVK